MLFVVVANPSSHDRRGDRAARRSTSDGLGAPCSPRADLRFVRRSSNPGPRSQSQRPSHLQRPSRKHRDRAQRLARNGAGITE